MRWTQPSTPLQPPLARRLAGVLAMLVALLAIAAPARGSAPNFRGSSADGKIVFFDTEEQLVEGDTDNKRDVYERFKDEDIAGSPYVTREVSLGPTGGNNSYAAQFEGASEDGTRVFFSTEERLVAEDTDLQTDVYMRDLEDGTTTLVTEGEAACAPTCGNGGKPATFAMATDDGTKVFFETEERLSEADTDGAKDLYLRNLATNKTTLVSAGETGCSGCGNGPFEVSRRGISADGRYAYFVTAEPLVAADQDSANDIYARDTQTGNTYLVSQGECTGCGNGGAVPIFDGASSAGTRVFFSSDEKLTGTDVDTVTDVYARDLPNGPTTLISGGSGGSGQKTASFAAASASGTHVFFTTAEGLDGSDADGANDVYEWTEGSGLSLVTSASCSSLCGATFEAVSADSTEVLFSTAEKLVPADQDENVDIYRQNVGGGEPVLVSRGEAGCSSCWNGPFDARFNEASADASHVVFTTEEGVLSGDDDEEDDIYARDVDANAGAGATSLITIAPSYCPLKKGNCGATFAGASANGQHVFFGTFERFTLEDGDKEADVYERDLGGGSGVEVTRLVSQGNDPNLELGPEPPILTGTNPKSPAASTTPHVFGDAADGAFVKLYTSADCSGEPVATGTAAEFLLPGFSVTVAPQSLTSFRATAEAEGFVSACSQPLPYQQMSSVEGPGGGGGGGSEVEDIVENNEGAFIPKLGPIVVATPSPAPRPGPTYVTPHTRITFAPASKTRSRNPTFRFTDSTGQAGTSFQCKLDRKSWRTCDSPLRLKRLSRGRHVIAIEAINGAGEVEPAPVKRSFKVVPR
jgi:Tol biopolymer transport system component